MGILALLDSNTWLKGWRNWVCFFETFDSNSGFIYELFVLLIWARLGLALLTHEKFVKCLRLIRLKLLQLPTIKCYTIRERTPAVEFLAKTDTISANFYPIHKPLESNYARMPFSIITIKTIVSTLQCLTN